MPKATTFAELQALSRGELVTLYDVNTEHVQLGLGFIREEIALRDADEANCRMLALTKQIWAFTLVVTIATVANVALFGFSMLR